jgi:DNA-binding GntR family transcriptional regulator
MRKDTQLPLRTSSRRQRVIELAFRQGGGGAGPLVLKKILRPMAGDSHRRASVDIHQYLRNCILANALPPETILSQVEVAECLKVSRTPVREAFRMLQEEGLISAAPNYRCKVIGFDPEELELLYVSRIMNEGVSAAITVQNLSDVDIQKLDSMLLGMNRSEKEQNFGEWINYHRAFHQMLLAGANLKLQRRMYIDCHRSERYVYNARQSGLTDIFSRAAKEHKEIVLACRRREPNIVASLLTQHLASACIDILNAIAPHWEPITLRTAAGFMLQGAAHFDEQQDQFGRSSKPRRKNLTNRTTSRLLLTQ